MDRTQVRNREAIRQVQLIAKRELDTRLRRRPFLISTLLILAVMLGYALLHSAGAFTGSGSQRTTVGIANRSQVTAHQLQQSAAQRGRHISVRNLGPIVHPEAQLRHTNLDMVLTGQPGRLQLTFRDTVDPNLQRVVNEIARSQTLTAQLKAAGVAPAPVQHQLAAARPRVHVLASGAARHRQRLLLGIVMVILLYLSLTLYGAQVATSVVEEKSTRVVEVLLATIRPWQLLIGKILGIGAVGFVQLTIVGLAGLVIDKITGAFALPGASISSLVLGLVWFVLGFLLYATVYASAGALVSRQQDAQTVVAPISMLIVIAFLLGVNLLSTHPNTPATVVLSVLPPFAPVLMPGRIALGGVTVIQLILAVVLTILGIGLLIWLAGRIYARAVLQTGSRVRLRDTLR